MRPKGHDKESGSSSYLSCSYLQNCLLAVPQLANNERHFSALLFVCIPNEWQLHRNCIMRRNLEILT